MKKGIFYVDAFLLCQEARIPQWAVCLVRISRDKRVGA
jgi:hypothetical protein